MSIAHTMTHAQRLALRRLLANGWAQTEWVYADTKAPATQGKPQHFAYLLEYRGAGSDRMSNNQALLQADGTWLVARVGRSTIDIPDHFQEFDPWRFRQALRQTLSNLPLH